MQRFRYRIVRVEQALREVWARIEWAIPPLVVLVVLVAVLLLLWDAYGRFDDIQRGIYVEAWGTVFDIVVVGLILSLFTIARDRRERINRYLEEIDDFKKWDNEEARLRIAGNVRRLANLGRTDIDFSGLVLRNFSFGNNDIQGLRGSTFSLGLRFDKMSKNSTQLEDVDFSFVDCTEVVFSRSSFDAAVLGLIGKNLSFVSAKLVGACFDSAKLVWTDYVADESKWFEDYGIDDETGQSLLHQVHHPAFSGADLTGCSFRYAQLDHADFRDAENILAADFSGAKGLETCFFDEEVRAQVLASAAKRTRHL